MNIQVFTEGCLEKVRKIASGTYGIVYEAKAINSDVIVAVKRMKLGNTVDFVGCIKELDFLCRLKDHPFILNILAISKGSPFIGSGSISPFRGNDTIFIDDKVSIITEKAAYDASSLIGKISYEYIKVIMIQSLLALEYMHCNNIIHRDIKPHNLLWFRNGQDRCVKFCDFGMSKVLTNQELNSCHTFTALYRAPEVIANYKQYDFKADIWSLGCIFFEFISKSPYIYMGDYTPSLKGDKELLCKILQKSPDPITESFYNKINSTSQFNISNKYITRSSYPWTIILNMNNIEISDFNRLGTHGKYEEFQNLLSNMLKLDPDSRFSATQALNHIFFKDHKDEIENCRKLYPPVDENKNNPNIKIINCIQRNWAMEIVEYFYQKKISGQVPQWYHDRILFHSINIFDKFLNNYYINKNNSFEDLDKHTVQYYFMVCIYIYIKYFLTLLEPCSFKDIVNTRYHDEKYMKIAEEFEWYLLKLFNFKVYENTLFEIPDDFNIILPPHYMDIILKNYMLPQNVDCKLKDYFRDICKNSNINISEYNKTMIRSIINVPINHTIIKDDYINTSISKMILEERTNHKIEVGLQTVQGIGRKININTIQHGYKL